MASQTLRKRLADVKRRADDVSLTTEIMITGFIMIISLVIAVESEKGDVAKIIYSTLLLGVTSYVATAMIRVLISSNAVGHGMERIAETISDGNKSIDLHSALLQNVSKIFYHDDDYMRKTASLAFEKFVKSIEAEDNKISLKGNFIAVEAYNAFWKQLTGVQNAQKKKGVEAPVVVYVTHSSSIRLWKSGNSDEMLGLQNIFMINGGEIFRVVIRGSNYDEPHSEYNDVISKMRLTSKSLKVFFVDDNKDRIELEGGEYLVVRIDRVWYALVWDISYGLHGTIVGCAIYKGDSAETYHAKWMGLMSKLKNADKSSISEDYLALKDQPSEEEMTRMCGWAD